LDPPSSVIFKEQQIGLRKFYFFYQAVADLVYSRCVYEVPSTPYVVNPLSVATNKSGKKHLILDLSILNKFVKKDKFKFEDWKIAIQLFNKDNLLFKFYLRSGYHHFDICPQQQTYLGFSWNNKLADYQRVTILSN